MTRIAFGLGALALLAGCVAPPAMTQAEFEQLQNEIELAQTRLVEADALTTFRGFLIALQDRGYQVRAVHPEGLILEADRAGRTAVAIAFVPQGPRRTAVRVAAESRSPFAPVANGHAAFYQVNFFDPAAARLAVPVTSLPAGMAAPPPPEVPPFLRLPSALRPQVGSGERKGPPGRT